MSDQPWLASYPDGIPTTIDSQIGAWSSVVELLSIHAKRFDKRVAFSALGGRMTYAATLENARDFAGYLQSLGVRKGDRVALMMPNCLQYPVAMFGTLLAGAIVVNVNPLYTARELKHQLTDSGATVIVFADVVAACVAAGLDGTDVRHLVATGLGDLVGGFKGAMVNFMVRRQRKVPKASKVLPQSVPFLRAMRRGRAQGFTPVTIGQSDLAFLQYTGGTTGVAKGAMLTHRNIIANVLQSHAWIGKDMSFDNLVTLTLLPLYHIFSLTANLLTYFTLGGESILIADPRNVKTLLMMIKGRTFDGLCGTNTLFANLLESKEFCARDFSRLKLVISGGMAMQRPLAERWFEVTGTPITEGYGLTESSPVLTVNKIDVEHPERMRFTGTVGLPVPSTEVRIHHAEGRWSEIGEPGEIWARGPQIMKGYWNRPDETAKVINEDGWLATGDIGVMDENGFTTIVDRLKDIIIVSGFNVYPSEIEEVVAMHPGVRESAAVGIKHETSGERIRLIVVPREAGVTRGDIIAHCRQHLTGYKIPTIVEFTNEPLPRSNVGKLLRRELPPPQAAGQSAAPVEREAQRLAV
jgi:long-chain acyl-CoA synthetase